MATPATPSKSQSAKAEVADGGIDIDYKLIKDRKTDLAELQQARNELKELQSQNENLAKEISLIQNYKLVIHPLQKEKKRLEEQLQSAENELDYAENYLKNPPKGEDTSHLMAVLQENENSIPGLKDKISALKTTLLKQEEKIKSEEEKLAKQDPNFHRINQALQEGKKLYDTKIKAIKSRVKALISMEELGELISGFIDDNKEFLKYSVELKKRAKEYEERNGAFKNPALRQEFLENELAKLAKPNWYNFNFNTATRKLIFDFEKALPETPSANEKTFESSENIIEYLSKFNIDQLKKIEPIVLSFQKYRAKADAMSSKSDIATAFSGAMATTPNVTGTDKLRDFLTGLGKFFSGVPIFNSVAWGLSSLVGIYASYTAASSAYHDPGFGKISPRIMNASNIAVNIAAIAGGVFVIAALFNPAGAAILMATAAACTFASYLPSTTQAINDYFTTRGEYNEALKKFNDADKKFKEIKKQGHKENSPAYKQAESDVLLAQLVLDEKRAARSAKGAIALYQLISLSAAVLTFVGALAAAAVIAAGPIGWIAAGGAIAFAVVAGTSTVASWLYARNQTRKFNKNQEIRKEEEQTKLMELDNDNIPKKYSESVLGKFLTQEVSKFEELLEPQKPKRANNKMGLVKHTAAQITGSDTPETIAGKEEEITVAMGILHPRLKEGQHFHGHEAGFVTSPAAKSHAHHSDTDTESDISDSPISLSTPRSAESLSDTESPTSRQPIVRQLSPGEIDFSHVAQSSPSSKLSVSVSSPSSKLSASGSEPSTPSTPSRTGSMTPTESAPSIPGKGSLSEPERRSSLSQIQLDIKEQKEEAEGSPRPKQFQNLTINIEESERARLESQEPRTPRGKAKLITSQFENMAKKANSPKKEEPKAEPSAPPHKPKKV